MIKSILSQISPHFVPTKLDLDCIEEITSSTNLYWDALEKQQHLLSEELFSTLQYFLWNSYINSPQQMISIPDFNKNWYVDDMMIHQEHNNRLEKIKSSILQQQLDHTPIIIDWWIKNPIRASIKIAKVWYCPDFTRLRLICENLPWLAITYSKLIEDISWYLYQISNRNYYLDYHNKYGTPRRWVNTSRNSKTNDMTTEVQFVTKRMNLCTNLNHPFDVAQTIDYKSEKSRRFIRNFIVKANILDLADLLNSDLLCWKVVA